MVSKMMQAEATNNRDVNVDTLMNILGRYYQIRDDYQDITGTVRRTPLSSQILSDSLFYSQPGSLHTTAILTRGASPCRLSMP